MKKTNASTKKTNAKISSKSTVKKPTTSKAGKTDKIKIAGVRMSIKEISEKFGMSDAEVKSLFANKKDDKTKANALGEFLDDRVTAEAARVSLISSPRPVCRPVKVDGVEWESTSKALRHVLEVDNIYVSRSSVRTLFKKDRSRSIGSCIETIRNQKKKDGLTIDKDPSYDRYILMTRGSIVQENRDLHEKIAVAEDYSKKVKSAFSKTTKAVNKINTNLGLTALRKKVKEVQQEVKSVSASLAR